MTLEQVVHVSGILRRLTDEEWDVLVRLVQHPQVDYDDPALVGRACDALADAAEALVADEQVAERSAPLPVWSHRKVTN